MYSPELRKEFIQYYSWRRLQHSYRKRNGSEKSGKFRAFYLDGHTDFIPPELSGNGRAAGMDLAIITGTGHEKLTDIDGLKPYLSEENIFAVGMQKLMMNNMLTRLPTRDSLF